MRYRKGKKAARKRAVRRQHEFFKRRGIKEAYVLLTVDDYGCVLNHRGGFDCAEYRNKGGYLWPSFEAAVKAAQHVLQKTDRVFGIFKLVAVAEKRKAPINVTKV